MNKFTNISRRDFTKSAIAIGVVASAAYTAQAAPQKKLPNILVVQTDQQSSWTLGCYGGTLVDTPHIDRLAKEGARLDNFFTNCAICTPSRGCFQTGRYPYSNGALHNSFPLNEDEVTLGKLFRDQGYDTGYIGKWHLTGPKRSHMQPDKNGVKRFACVLPNEYAYGYEDTAYMIEHFHGKKITGTLDNPIFGVPSFIGKDKNARSFDFEKSLGDENSYTTDYLCDRAMEFMAEKRDDPFFLFLAIPDPHNPFHVREPYESMYKPENMPLPENFSHRENLPQWADSWNRRAKHGFAPGRTAWPDGAMDAETYLRNMKSKYCGMVKHIDDCVGEIYASLEQQGILDNTIVIFTTDHGDYMGEHGLAGKPCVYEGVFRIPFIVRYPDKVKQGLVVNHHVATVDFMPTIAALAGVAGSGREEGNNAAPLLQGKPVDWDDAAFQHRTPNPKTPEIAPDRAGVFTPKWHLCYVYSGRPGMEHVLFDRRKDPLEMNNLFYHPEYRGTVEKLTEQILKQRESINAPEVEWLKNCPQF